MKEEQLDEIDLIALIKNLWIKRGLIIKVSALFAFFGLLIALLSPKQYKAETKFVPQVEGQNLNSNLSGLAALAGVNLTNETSTHIPASLYPSVAESTAYQLKLLNTSIKMANGTELLFKDYLLNHQKRGLLGTVLKFTLKPLHKLFAKPPKSVAVPKDRDFYVISYQEYEQIETLVELLSVNYNQKENVVNLSIQLSHPEVAAQVAIKAMENLQQTIITYKIKNAEKILEYVTAQYQIKEKEFLNIQKELAEFNDSHKNIGTAIFENKRSKLETQYNLSFSLYKELALQKEQAQLQVNKDTPIFSIIQPVTQPNKKNEPKRFLILILWTFLGVVTTCGYVLLFPALKKIKKEITAI